MGSLRTGQHICSKVLSEGPGEGKLNWMWTKSYDIIGTSQERIFSVLEYKILQRHIHWDTEEKTQDADKSLRHRRLSSHLASVLPHLHNVLAQHNHLSSTLFSATIGHDASHQDSCANTSAGKDPRALSDDSCQAFAIYLIFSWSDH